MEVTTFGDELVHYLFKFSTRTWHKFGFCLISLYQFDQLRFIVVVVLLMWLLGSNYVVCSVVSEFLLIIIFGKLYLDWHKRPLSQALFSVSRHTHWDPAHETRVSRAPHVFPMFRRASASLEILLRDG